MGCGCGRQRVPVKPIELESSDAAAAKMFAAMKGLGTDEDTIYQVLASVKDQDQWLAIQNAFNSVDRRKSIVTLSGKLMGVPELIIKDGDFENGLKAAIESELSSTELLRAKKCLWGEGIDARVWYSSVVDDTVARLYLAMKGLGTAEQEIYDALNWVKTQEMWEQVQEAYKSTHPNFYKGDLRHAFYSELNHYDLNKAKARLRRNGVMYDDEESEILYPGDVVDILRKQEEEVADGSTKSKNIMSSLDDDDQYTVFEGRCELKHADIIVVVHNAMLKGPATPRDIKLPVKVMVDATMYVAPKIIVLGASKQARQALEIEAAYKTRKDKKPTLFMKRIGDAFEEAYDNFMFKMKCKPSYDYFQRANSDEIEPTIRSKRILRFIVTWKYSVAGSIVTLSLGDDKPYHAAVRLWLEGGEILFADRTDKGIVWHLKTGKDPTEEDSKEAFLDGIKEQCEGTKSLEKCIDATGSTPIVMLDFHFLDGDDAPDFKEQANKLMAEVPGYTSMNPEAVNDESDDYCDGNLRKPCTKPLCFRQRLKPSMSHLLCGLYQIAEFTYGAPSYFEGYHPRKLNCQAFVFDCVTVLLTPPKFESPLGSCLDWSDYRSLDNIPAEGLLKKIKAHIVQDADRMLNSGGNCKLGTLAQTTADFFMF